MKLDKFDRLILSGTIAGAVGFGLVWLPLSLLFLAAEAFSLAAVIDRRTVEERGEGDMT